MTTMAVFLVVPVVASRSSAHKLPIKKCLRKVLGGFVCGTHVNRDAMLCEQVERARSHTACNDNFDALLMKPTRQNPGRMWWRNNPGLVDDLFRCRVGYYQGEFFAMAKMPR